LDILALRRRALNGRSATIEVRSACAEEGNVRAARFGRAILLACIHESAKRERVVSGSGAVHQSLLRRAKSGSAKPARSSISAKVRTTASAYRSSRYL
jgi:hypothetical protein